MASAAEPGAFRWSPIDSRSTAPAGAAQPTLGQRAGHDPVTDGPTSSGEGAMNASPRLAKPQCADPPVASRPDSSRGRCRALRGFRASPRVRRQRLPRQVRSRPARFWIEQIGAAEACRHPGARRRLTTGVRGFGSGEGRCRGKVGHAGPGSLRAVRSGPADFGGDLRGGACPTPRARLRLRRSRRARPLRPRSRKPRPPHRPRRRRARRRRPRRRCPTPRETPRLSLSR